jgi:hypothetical protein
MFKEQSSTRINLMFAPPRPTLFPASSAAIAANPPPHPTTHTQTNTRCHADLTWYQRQMLNLN